MNKSETDSTKMSILGYCGWKYSLARPENHFKTNKSRFNKHHYPLKMIDSCWNGHPPSKNAFESINLKDFFYFLDHLHQKQDDNEVNDFILSSKTTFSMFAQILRSNFPKVTMIAVINTSFNHDKILSCSLLTYEVIQDLVHFGCLSSIFETINISDGQPSLPNSISWRHFFDSDSDWIQAVH